MPLLNDGYYQGDVSAPFFPGVYAVYKTGRLALSGGFMPVGGGGGDLTLEQAVAMNFLTQEQANQLAGGLGAAYNEAMSISQIQGAYDTNAMTLAYVAGQVGDRRVDARQAGTGITPLLGVNLQLSEQLNIGIKYEFLTKLELENETEIDETGMFPDGAKTRSDMPAMLSVGAAYKATPQLNISGGVHYYFDKTADYGKTVDGNRVDNDVVIDNNFVELGLGLEYDITESMLVSAGYLRTITGVNENYHSDLSHSLSTHSVGLGGRYAINEMVAVNLGFLMTFYDENQRDFTMQGQLPYSEIYNREVMVFAIGLDFKF